jgi:glucose dehydrogenase
VAFLINTEYYLFVLGNSYNSEERIVCSGYDNGDIKMFDLKTMSLRWETNVKNGVSLCLQYSFLDLYVNTLLSF